jgi:magnesium chelatase subunit H
MYQRLLDLNPHSVRSLTNRLLEAHNRGYWNPDEDVLEKLQELVGAPGVEIEQAVGN